MKAALRVALFPVVMFGGLWVANALMNAGITPSATVGIMSFGSALLVLIFERILPFVPQWNRPRGDLITDLLHTVFSFVAMSELMRAAFFAGLVALAGSVTPSWSIWPDALPWPAQLALALIVTELPYYWAHRLMHTVPAMWRLHAVHHSAPRLYWLNAGRFHPLDAGFIYFTQLPVLILMGCPESMTALFLTVGAIHGLFQHGNVDVRIGPLNHIFAMAELHRWHHARTGPGARSNYGGNIILWDQVFRTRYLPDTPIGADDIGFEGDETYPKDWPGQLAAPFRQQG